jgi:Conserved TM helix
MNEQLETIDQVKSTVLDLVVRFGPRLFAAILVLVIGILLSR